ncbi:MAG: hypothetical protein ABUL77_04305 [Bacteroidota bacterium]
MPNRSPYGNLTATLVVIVLFELVVNRLLGRLFLAPGCRSGLGCFFLQAGLFLYHLTGALAVVVAGGGIAGHLRRAELFPRGVRLTIAGLSSVFLLLVALSLAFGRMPERYHIHLETSFGFVLCLLVLSFVGSRVISLRIKVAFVLLALPTILHVFALVAARAGWLRDGAITPDRLTAAGELTLLLGVTTAPLSLLSPQVPRARVLAGVALGAGVAAFFFVALLGRTDLVQTVALYGVHLELPRALSVLGGFYVLGLFGFVTATAILLLSPGASRLVGMGMCLLALAGYQTTSSVSLAVSLCGLLSVGTGTLRAAGGERGARLSAGAWRSLLAAVGAGISDSSGTPADSVLIEVTAGGEAAGDGESDRGTVRASRRGRLVALEIRRVQSAVRALDVTVGVPGDGAPDATIESHEAWLSRRPEDRSPLPRAKTGDEIFDRRLGVRGRAPMHDRALRRRVLRLADGTITLWTGAAARFVAPGNPTETLRRFAQPVAPSTVRALVELVDTLIDLVEGGEQPDPASGPPSAADA